MKGVNLNEFKLFTQRLGLLSIVNILIGLSSFILLPVLTRNLTITEYGIWIQVIVTIDLMLNIATLGLYFAMLRFLPSLKEKLEIQEEYYSMFFIILLFSLILSFIIFLLSSPIAAALFDNQIKIVELLSLIIFVSSLNYFIINYFRTFQEMKKYSVFLFLQTYLTVLFVVYLVISGHGIFGAIIGYLISQILLFLIMKFFIIKEISLRFPKFKNFKLYLTFSLPLVIGGVSYWVAQSCDRYVIGILLGSAFVGYYSPGYMIGTIIMMIVTPFSSIILPEIAKNYDSGEIKKSENLLNYSMKLFLFIAIPSVFGLSILSKPLLILLTTPNIASEGYLITPFVALGSLFYCIYIIGTDIYALEKKTKIIGIILVITAIINLFGNILAVPYFGIIGSAAITLISFIITCFFSLAYIKKYLNFNLNFDLRFIIKSIISSLFMTIFIFLISPNGILKILIAIVMASAIYVILLLILGGIDKNDLKFINNLFIKN